MCIYICTYICIHICIHSHIRISTHVHIHLNLQITGAARMIIISATLLCSCSFLIRCAFPSLSQISPWFIVLRPFLFLVVSIFVAASAPSSALLPLLICIKKYWKTFLLYCVISFKFVGGDNTGLLPPLAKCWNYRHTPQCPACPIFLKMFSAPQALNFRLVVQLSSNTFAYVKA